MMTNGKIRLSCIMLARNLISQGYPFVETILSMIPYCEEMIICEGYSNDGTYEVLEKLRELHKDKIIIIRKNWEGKKNLGEVFAQTLNKVVDECKGNYILKLDPDHVFDKETIETLLFLANMYPKVKIFYLPYLYFIGNWVIKPELWGPTFFKKEKYIRFKGDSGGMKITPFGILKFGLENIRNPIGILKSIYKSIYYAYVPKPVYHYHALFPGNYLKRIEEHKKFYKKYDWSPYDKVIKQLKYTKNWDRFWEVVARKIVEKSWNWYGSRKVMRYPADFSQPDIMLPLQRQWTYKVREELIK